MGPGIAFRDTDVGKPMKLFKKVVNEDTFPAALKCIHLPTLNLRACKLKYDIWEDLSSREIQIDELKLDNTNLRENTHGLPKCLASAQVKKLSLVNTKLKTENFKTFLEELGAKNSKEISLHSVNLMHVKIDTEGFEILAKILNLLPSDVQQLNVTNCGLTDVAIDTFYQTLSDDKVIHKLALGQTDRITPDGMKTIGKLAEKCHAKKLDLAVCYLSDEHLAEAEESFPDSIESLSLRENTKLSADQIVIFAIEWKSLKEIDVRDAWFDRQASEFLKDVLPNCKIICDVFEEDESAQVIEDQKEVKDATETLVDVHVPSDMPIVKSVDTHFTKDCRSGSLPNSVHLRVSSAQA